jgi:hypothetical protein
MQLINIQSPEADHFVAASPARHNIVSMATIMCHCSHKVNIESRHKRLISCNHTAMNRIGFTEYMRLITSLPRASIVISSFPTVPSCRITSIGMHRPNFTQCGQLYISNSSLISHYNYSGHVVNIPANPRTQITYEGCTAVCGSGNEYYPWAEISATITTWVLPILGTLLQAPFESNAFWRTVKAINRWIGSPISSLASILSDIDISGKCALFGTHRHKKVG